MKKANNTVPLIHLYLFGRYILKNAKNYSAEEMMMTSIMVMLNEKPMTIRGLTNLFDVQHAFMSMTLQKMYKKKFVLKKKNHGDPRYKLVSLSANGKRMIKDRIQQISDFHCKNIFKNLTNKEIKQLDKLIMRLNCHYTPGGPPLLKSKK